jgi:hypothetical protein
VLKPCKWVARRQAVDRGGASSRVDRAAHQNQAFRGPYRLARTYPCQRFAACLATYCA